MNFDTLFPDEREKGETRLRQCQLVMLRMLKIFDHLCTRHDIKYFLTGGTLLGAIRHQGFIPWDDDLDVGMTRENYEKFVRLAVPELPRDIFFQNDETDPHYPSCHMVEARLRDKYSSYPRKDSKWHEGLQVDIFVYDSSFLPHNLFIIIQNMMLILLNNSKRRADLLKFISKYSPCQLVYSSSYLQNFGMFKCGTYITEKEYSPLQKAKFEDLDVYVPAEWDSYLKRQYGDYMQLPPAEKQHGHFNSKNLPNPFRPCQHTEVLFWKQINNSAKETIKNTEI